jgi:hypothetical protein
MKVKFNNLSLVGGEQSALCPQGKQTSKRSVRGWVGPRAHVDTLVKVKVLESAEEVCRGIALHSLDVDNL